MAEAALAGLKVVDLTDERGIYGAKLLGDLGADVVRPEPPGGDPLRTRGPLTADQQSLYYAYFGTSRKTVVVDVDDAGHRDQLKALVANADIVLHCDQHWAQTCLPEFDDDRQIVIDITSFGTGGPWVDYLAPDLIAGALAGAAATTGHVDTPPLKNFGELNFMVVGSYIAVAALSALRAKREQGVTQKVTLSAHECIASCLEQVFMMYWYFEVMLRPDEQVLPRRGSTHWSNAFTVMNGKDGSIMITPIPDTDMQLAWLAEEDAHGDLFEPHYAEPENLAAFLGRLMQLLAQWVSGKEVEALFHEAQERHIPYGWVQPLARLGDNPQLVAREWFKEYQTGLGTVKGPGAPYHLSATPWRLQQAETPIDATEILTAIEWQANEKEQSSEGSDLPLAGIKVLDFSHVLAGPYATRVLGDMGADVVKVNSLLRATTTNAPESPYYIMWNRNKRALSLNMANEEARTLCRELVQQADIVIDNFSVGVLDRWGVGYDQVSPSNPGVIYIQMSGMGDNGPWSNFVTYAPTIHALSGLTSLTSVPGRGDIGIGYSYNDHQSGLHGAVAVLAALEARHRSGRGQRIEVSQFEVGANFAGPSLMDLFANDVAAEACANKLPYDKAAPHNVYRCAPLDVAAIQDERWIAIACMNDEQWRNLVSVMGSPEWATQPEFANVDGRLAGNDLIDEKIAEWTGAQDDYELMAKCQAAGVPAGVVQNGRDLCERDPQLERVGFQVKIDDPHPDVGQTWADRLPLHFSKTPVTDYRRSRVLGEDNKGVLADWLGMSAEEVAEKERQGIVE